MIASVPGAVMSPSPLPPTTICPATTRYGVDAESVEIQQGGAEQGEAGRDDSLLPVQAAVRRRLGTRMWMTSRREGRENCRSDRSTSPYLAGVDG